MIFLADFHHSQLHQSFIWLVEKRLGGKLYRPSGREWFDRGYYHHPLEGEAIANLTPSGGNNVDELLPPISSKHLWNKEEHSIADDYYAQDNIKFRWLPFDRVKEVDYLICSSDRNESQFVNLKRDFGLKAKICRYIGNGHEPSNPNNWDIGLMATKQYYEQFKDVRPCILYHPEFDLNIYKFFPLPTKEETHGLTPIVRSFLNFMYHHRSPGDAWETWVRYWDYCNDIGATALLHGLGTPPHGQEVELDVILDTCFDRTGRSHLKDRSTWPDLRWNQGEPFSHAHIAELMRLTNAAVHIKRSDGYGYIIHSLAAMGRPPIVEHGAYHRLSAFSFLQHKETCLHVSGHADIDKENLRWLLEPENNQRCSETLHKRFEENVNWENEAEQIRKLL